LAKTTTSRILDRGFSQKPLIENFFGFGTSYSLIFFDVVLHVGTLLVILSFFKERIMGILSDLMHLNFKTENGRMVPLTLVGVLPTYLIGIVISEFMKGAFQSTLLVGVAFLSTGMILYSSKFAKEKIANVTYPIAVFIGIAQGVALIPGISRSGITISLALLLGVKRRRAFDFSFILSIPAILGALCYTTYTEYEQLVSISTGLNELFVATIVAIIVGYFALKLLWKTLLRRKFYLFSFYCWLVGGLVIFIQVISTI